MPLDDWTLNKGSSTPGTRPGQRIRLQNSNNADYTNNTYTNNTYPNNTYPNSTYPDNASMHNHIPQGQESGNIRSRILLGGDLKKGRPLSVPGARTIFTSKDGSRFTMTEEQYSMHLLLLGGIGSGKTNVFYKIVDSQKKNMTKDDIMIIFDSKGDFYKRVPGDVVIGNNSEYRARGHVWNIYGEVMGRIPQSDEHYTYRNEWDANAKEIMKALFKSRRSSTQPFFADAAADLIALKMIDTLRRGALEEMNTYALKQFFNDATVGEYDAFVNRTSPSAKMYYGDGTTPQALAVFAYINSLMSSCFIGVFGDVRPQGREFAMRDLVSRKGRKIVLVEYDLGVGEVLGPIYQMLYDQALKEALGRSEEEKGNVFLICDEFKLLGALDHIDDGLNMGRSLGVKICAGLQNISQLYALYGEDRGKSILSGFSNMFCFRTGDAETRKYISDHFGNNYTDFELWNDERDKTHIQREGNVVEQWDVLGLRRGQAIIDVWSDPPRGPFVFQFDKY